MATALALTTAGCWTGVRSSQSFQVTSLPSAGSFAIAPTGAGCFELEYRRSNSSSGTGSCLSPGSVFDVLSLQSPAGRTAIGGIASERVVRVRVRARGRTFSARVRSDRTFLIEIPFYAAYRAEALDRHGRVIGTHRERRPPNLPRFTPSFPPPAGGGGQAPP